MLRKTITSKSLSAIKSSACQLICHRSSLALPEFTKDKYSVKRGNYATITDADLKHFESILSPDRCITDPNDIETYNMDFYRTYRGCSQLMLKPKTTEEVSAILRHCNARKLAVCPQGGNTGQMAGATPIFDEIILSMQFLNAIEYVDETAGILVCQSGCVLEKLEQHLLQHNLIMPIDLGAKGTCQIGGNISTNAGGVRLVRYGNLHGNVLGIEAVKADGTILDLMSNFKKDNTGYHLKHLFIGSEGTLGVVTKLAIACPTASKSLNVALVGLNNFDDVLKTYLVAKRELSEILSACELMDHASYRISIDYFKLNSPLDDYPFYLLLETSGSNLKHDEEKINSFLEKVLDQGIVQNGVTVNEPSKVRCIWKIRELIPMAKANEKYMYQYDISVPVKNYYDIVPALKKQFADEAKAIFGFGHIGDSNLHITVLCDSYNEEFHRRVDPFVFDFTARLKGSISAEHGIGFKKKNYLKIVKQKESLDLMKDMKAIMDPNGILNPYKIFCN